MAQETPLFIIHLLGFIAFLWHGLYVLTRGKRTGVSRLTGVTAIFTGALFLTGGLEEIVHQSPLVQRALLGRLDWCFSVIPAALWLRLSMQLNVRAVALRNKSVLYGAYGAAVLLVILGSATNLVRGYDTDGKLYTAGPLYLVYVIFVVSCAGLAVVNFMQMRAPVGESTAEGRPDAAEAGNRVAAVYSSEVRMLILGGICFLLGVGYNTVLQLSNHLNPILGAPAWALLLIGLCAVGGTVGVQSNLLLGRDMRRDFLYNFTGLLILVGPMLVVIAVVVGLDSERARLLSLLVGGLVAIGHTLYDIERQWLDKVFFTPVVQEERAAARAYVEALATPPAGSNPELATRKAFDDAVRRALTHLSDPTKLATSPLLNLQVVGRAVGEGQLEDNRLNRAAALKEMLLDLLEGLHPSDRSGGIAGDAFRFYNCLYYPYVQGINRRRAPAVLRQLQERRKRNMVRRVPTSNAWLIGCYRWMKTPSTNGSAAALTRLPPHWVNGRRRQGA